MKMKRRNKNREEIEMSREHQRFSTNPQCASHKCDVLVELNEPFGYPAYVYP
jgi:hypothetical protein